MKILSFIWILFVIIAVAINVISFNIDCKHRLKRAADANSIELATKELEAVLKYAEDNQLTSGYTSIIYNTPDEEVELTPAERELNIIKKEDGFYDS